MYKRLPGSNLEQRIEGKNLEEIDDVDFGRAYTERGRAKKAIKAGYVKNFVTSDSGDIISVWRKLK